MPGDDFSCFEDNTKEKILNFKQSFAFTGLSIIDERTH